MAFTLSDITPQVLARFYGKVVEADGCWLWMAGHDRGAPVMQISTGGSNERANRIAYAIHNNELAGKIRLKTACGNKDCVRPSHIIKDRQRTVIEDEFTHLNISRERKRQLRKMAHDLCSKPKCNEPLAGYCYCMAHMIENCNRTRAIKKPGRRNRSLTFHFQDFREKAGLT